MFFYHFPKHFVIFIIFSSVKPIISLNVLSITLSVPLFNTLYHFLICPFFDTKFLKLMVTFSFSLTLFFNNKILPHNKNINQEKNYHKIAEIP